MFFKGTLAAQLNKGLSFYPCHTVKCHLIVLDLDYTSVVAGGREKETI